MISIEAKPFSKEVSVPSSKSYSNRVLILGAVSKETVEIHNLSQSSDVQNMLRCFEQVGIVFKHCENTISITSSFPKCEIVRSNPIYLHTGDGGTTNRFIIPLLALGTNCYRITASEKMAERPIDELVTSLRALGASVNIGLQSDDFWLEIQGGGILIEGSVEVDCKRSTQFASGLMLATANTPVKILAKNVENSKKYLEMSELLIKEFEGGKRRFDVPVDFSSISYPLALAAVTGSTTIKNYGSRDLYQPDSVLIDILGQCGAQVSETKNFLNVAHRSLQSFGHNCSQCPDLTPTLAYLAAFSDGVSTLSGLEVLRYKESDRIREIIVILETYGVEHHYHENNYTLDIVGNSASVQRKVEVAPPADHRIVMIHYLFMRTLAGGILHNEQHVNKSFPSFFSIME